MAPADLRGRARQHLARLCGVLPDRRPGSPGNAAATAYVAHIWRESAWSVHEQWFDVVDWAGEPGALRVGDRRWDVWPSPYSTGVDASGRLLVARAEQDLARDLGGRVLLLLDELAREPMTPLNYPFYGSEVHARILRRLQEQRPVAVLAGTGTAPDLAGALDPFPLIEDGSFAVPTGNLRPGPAADLATHDGSVVDVVLPARRWPATACNVVARRGHPRNRLLLVAHVDSKPGTPGAVDNAAGVTVLLLLAEVLAEAELGVGVELLAVNGEDYYAASGEVAYLEENAERLDEIALVVNVDGAGFAGGRTVVSRYQLPAAMDARLDAVLGQYPSLCEGPAWFQSDHMVFVPRGVPAIAVTSESLDVVLAEVAHSPADTPDRVDPALLVDIAAMLAALATVGDSGVVGSA